MTRLIASNRAVDGKFLRIQALLTWILRSPLRGLISNRFILVTFVRHKGGSSTIPVSYFKEGDALLVTDQGIWQNNLRAGTAIWVQWNGMRRRVYCEVIKETAQLVPLIRMMVNTNRAFREFLARYWVRTDSL
jgi:hypothetical protein